MVIITGTGRSGTATLARLWGGHHEFRVAYILEKYFRQADPHSDPFATIESRVGVMMDLHQGVDRRSFVDSSNLYIHFLDAAYLLNPSAKFVLSVRNGKDFVRSAFSRGWHTMGSFGIVPLRGDPYFPLWDTMTPLQRNAWIWSFRNRRALEGFGAIAEQQKMIVRIEEVHRPEVVEQLEHFTGITLKEKGLAVKKHNAHPSLSFPSKEEWTEEMNREFEEIAGEMMRFFHYE
jgi:hypothetical protein